MAEGQVDFELVAPERLLVSEGVDMVVIPGGDGDFGVLPRHAPMISTVRTGVIRIYDGRTLRDRIFVAGGFAEVTPERCTVLAEQAVPVGDIDRAETEQKLKDAREDLADAKDDAERTKVTREIAILEQMLAAATS